MYRELAAIAVGTLASEDLTLAASGVLVAQGTLTFESAVAACAIGIFAGDLMLYAAGRATRRWPVAARLFARWIPERAVARGAQWLNHNGLAVVMMSRFTPGLRLPTYFAAGVLPTSLPAFAGYFLLASLVWTPLLVGATGWLSATAAGSIATPAGGIGAFALAASALWLLRTVMRQRRRLAGFLRRKIQWEFWPVWAAYLPVVPYLLLLAIRHRSLTVFTAANPAIPGGGLAGESKVAILAALQQAGAETGEFTLIPPGGAFEFQPRSGWPIVLKPDVGERGSGVAIVRNGADALADLRSRRVPVIAQSYHPGLEFGLFYYRFPGEERGHLLSITEKRFPHVRGDGQSTFAELVWNDPRAVCLAETYLRGAQRDRESVPAAGEIVTLVEVGSHCRGAVFVDGTHLRTERLERELDRISHGFPGFHFGRFDVRAESVEDLQEGRFRVIELNGVGAEAAHIYDPAVSIGSAYASLFRQWRIAFAIGAANRERGVHPMGLRELVRLLRSR